MNVSGQPPRADLTKILSVIGEIKKEGEKGKKGVPDSLDFSLLSTQNLRKLARARIAKTPPHVLICGTGQRSLFYAMGASLSAKSVQSTDVLDS